MTMTALSRTMWVLPGTSLSGLERMAAWCPPAATRRSEACGSRNTWSSTFGNPQKILRSLTTVVSNHDNRHKTCDFKNFTVERPTKYARQTIDN